MCTLLSVARKRKIQRIVFGYIQQNYKGLVPKEMSLLCVLYFGDYNELQQLIQFPSPKSSTETFSIYKDVIQFSDYMELECEIYGYSTMCHIVSVVIAPKELHENIDYCIISCSLFCDETNTTQRRLRKIYKNDINIRFGFNGFEIASFKDLNNQLTFRINIDSLQFKFKKRFLFNQQNIYYYPSMIGLPQYTKFKWDFNPLLLLNKNTTQNYNETYCSPLFENWCISGYKHIKYEYQEYFSINLYHIPYKIQQMKLQCITQHSYDKRPIKYIYKLTNNDSTFINRLICDKNVSLKGKLKEGLWFTVKIKILKIYNEQNIIIPTSDWSKYGIIQN